MTRAIDFTPELVAYIPTILECNIDTGRCFWKSRPAQRFPSERIYKVWNSRFAGKEAGNKHYSHGLPRCIIISFEFWERMVQLKAHRIIFSLGVRPLRPDEILDHRDGNPFNNRLDNLRITTWTGNARNCAASRNHGQPRDLPKGVSRNGKNGYLAQITVDYKWIYLGTHRTVEAASKAYQEAARKYFGEFARE